MLFSPAGPLLRLDAHAAPSSSPERALRTSHWTIGGSTLGEENLRGHLASAVSDSKTPISSMHVDFIPERCDPQASKRISSAGQARGAKAVSPKELTKTHWRVGGESGCTPKTSVFQGLFAVFLFSFLLLFVLRLRVCNAQRLSMLLIFR